MAMIYSRCFIILQLRTMIVTYKSKGSLKQHSIFGTQINSIYGIKSSEKVKNNPISYNTTKLFLYVDCFRILKLEL